VVRLEFCVESQRGETVQEVEIREPVELVSPRTDGDACEKQVEALKAEMKVEIEAAIATARNETREAIEEEFSARVEQERMRVDLACERFVEERSRYFRGVEEEIVKLSLSIARRILHREAAVDPLLLRGVVRVALDEVVKGSEVRLRVPEGEAKRWRKLFVKSEEGAPALIEDSTFAADECVLEVDAGRVELGVAAQLKEIEHGFSDLLARRPK
jgi:flagellar assembly protein FliH